MDVGEIKIIGPRDNYQILEEFPEGTDVIYDEARGVFSIYIPLYFDGTFMDATIEVNGEGDVSIVDTKMSIRGIQNKIDFDSTSDY